jgi:hypothetical protein
MREELLNLLIADVIGDFRAAVALRTQERQEMLDAITGTQPPLIPWDMALPEDVPVRTPSRWRSWLALALQAVAWWLRRAVARAVSGVVQETVRAVLVQLHGPLPPHRQIEYEPRNGRFHDPGGLFPGSVPPDDFADERSYDPFDERFPETLPGNRLRRRGAIARGPARPHAVALAFLAGAGAAGGGVVAAARDRFAVSGHLGSCLRRRCPDLGRRRPPAGRERRHLPFGV